MWKHPNLRVAYVAQHAFHHIEDHLDMTPNQYIQWRYATGEDRESLDKVSRKVSSSADSSREWVGGGGRAGSGGYGERRMPVLPCPALLALWLLHHPCSCVRACLLPTDQLTHNPHPTHSTPNHQQMKEEEEKKMAEVKVVDGVKRIVDKLLGRRKQKRGYEYEVQWKGEAETSWLTRDRLEEMGFQKLLTDIDMKVRLGWRGRCW